MSIDTIVEEAAYIVALTEMVESSDTDVKIQVIRALQKSQRSKCTVIT